MDNKVMPPAGSVHSYPAPTLGLTAAQRLLNYGFQRIEVSMRLL
jgi:hypothetical protein